MAALRFVTEVPSNRNQSALAAWPAQRIPDLSILLDTRAHVVSVSRGTPSWSSFDLSAGNSMARVLVVDDESLIREILSVSLPATDIWSIRQPTVPRRSR